MDEQGREHQVMQGTLNEIDIRSILQLIALGQRTGELLIEAYRQPIMSSNINASIGTTIGSTSEVYRAAAVPTRELWGGAGSFWFMFFRDGQIVYAADSSSSLRRLGDYLQRYKLQLPRDSFPDSQGATTAPEYSYLWELLEKRLLTPAQGRSIISGMVKETLFDLLTLHQGYFIFDIGSGLTPQLTTLETEPIVTEVMKQVQEWKQLHPHIQSPEQCPIVIDRERLQAFLPENAFKTLDTWADGKTSLRQLARYLNREILPVAKAIYPCIQQGWVQMPASVPLDANQQRLESRMATGVRPQVVCIDDDGAIGKMIEYTLQAHGYRVTIIQDPLESISQIFQLQPDLILCDLVMPKLDGYDLCGMLRQSTAFRQTPILMLTGKDGFIDRVRAKMVGATDYLTKPFQEQELLMLLEKYIGLGEPNI